MGIVARQSIKSSLATYLGIAIGFVTTFFVLTDCLSTEEIGLTRVLVDAATLFAAFAQLGTNASIIKYFPYFKDSAGNKAFWGLIIIFPLLGFTILTFVLLLFRGEIVDIYSVRSPLIREYFMLLIPLSFFTLYVSVFETSANALMRITVPRVIRDVVIRVLNLVCYLLYGHHIISFDVFVILFTASWGLAMLLNLCYLLSMKQVSFRFDFKSLDRRNLNGMLRYSLFMTLIVFASYSQLFGSLFIGAKEGLALAGVYSIAFYIANIVDVPYKSLGSISRPIVATASKNGDSNELSSIAKNVALHQFLASTLLLFFIWINLDALFAVIPHGEDFVAGKWVVLILGIEKVVNCTFSVSIDILNYSKYYRISLFFVLLLSITTLALNGWFVTIWGINGAAAAILLSFTIYYTGLLIYIRWKLKVSTFSFAQVKVGLVILLLLVFNQMWSFSVTPYLHDELPLIITDALIKSLILTVIAAVALYKFHVSPHVNSLLDRLTHIFHKDSN